MSSQGYVGFTSQTVSKRIASHWFESRSGTNLKLYNSMRKYSDDIVVETLVEGPIDYCLSVEYRLRPDAHIGWNNGVGGVAPSLGISPTEGTRSKISATKIANNYVASEETRKKISDAGKGRKYSEESRKKMSEKALLRPKRLPWNTSRANPHVWLLAQEAYEIYAVTKSHNCTAKALGIEYCKLYSMVEKFKTGWIPMEDASWVLFKSEVNKTEI